MHLVKTKDRKQCGIPEFKKDIDEITITKKDGSTVIQKFKGEIIHYDSEGFIIGVSREWQ